MNAELILNLFYIRNEQSDSYSNIYIEGWKTNFIFLNVTIIFNAETSLSPPLQHTKEVR
jgi:hypothetical protein